jgi:transcriptional regulator GlxA family with amidase domain
MNVGEHAKVEAPASQRGVSYLSELTWQFPAGRLVQTALTYAKEHLSTSLSVDALANAACLGPRQFSRLNDDV